jgi:hypothetical protein
MLQNVFAWLDEHYDKIAVEEAIMNPATPGNGSAAAHGVRPRRSSAQILSVAETPCR